MADQGHSWQSIHDIVRQRIQDRYWKPGELIPGEADLAEEFGCARATVNRALRQLAESGLLDRKRKAGTRVALHPVRKAILHIPIVRKEIEERNQVYGYALLNRKKMSPSDHVRARMQIASDTKLLKIEALHLADGKPFLLEDRWVNFHALPDILKADLSVTSANEWLVMNAPFTGGNIAFSALSATKRVAELMGTQPGAALFAIERSTWEGETALTEALMIYGEGYRMYTAI